MSQARSAEREALVVRFERWVRQHKPDLDPADARTDALVALRWKPEVAWTLADVGEFLLVWCPRNLATPAERCAPFIASLRAWFSFLGAENVVPTKVAVELSAWCRAQWSTFTEAMASTTVAPQSWLAITAEWLALRPVDEVVRDLEAALADPSISPGELAETLAGLGDLVGDRSTEISRSLLGGPHDGIAIHALLTTGQLRPDEVSEARLLGSIVDALAIAWDRGRAAELIETVGTGAGIEKLWRTDRPRTAEMLEAIGAYHPDRKIAKTARKTAIRHWTRRSTAG